MKSETGPSGRPVIPADRLEQEKGINRENDVLKGGTAEECYSGPKTLFNSRNLSGSEAIQIFSEGLSLYDFRYIPMHIHSYP